MNECIKLKHIVSGSFKIDERRAWGFASVSLTVPGECDCRNEVLREGWGRSVKGTKFGEGLHNKNDLLNSDWPSSDPDSFLWNNKKENVRSWNLQTLRIGKDCARQLEIRWQDFVVSCYQKMCSVINPSFKLPKQSVKCIESCRDEH